MIDNNRGGVPDLPKDLQDAAIVLANEPAWTADLTLKVIEYLACVGVAIVGVEHWEAIGHRPKWIASGDYHCNITESTVQYVQCCAECARQFIERQPRDPASLFNLTWRRLS
jgi:hypothetical protein